MPLMPENLKAKNKNEISILKQADVVMLMFLLKDKFSLETQKLNFNYYEKRTLHRSSLSPSIHCLMGLRVGDSKRAYDYLERSAYVDLDNNQGNTREGIHAASAGGSWQAVVFGYCGMQIDSEGILTFEPNLPKEWEKVEYSINWKGQLIDILIKKNKIKVSYSKQVPAKKLKYKFRGEIRAIN